MSNYLEIEDTIMNSKAPIVDKYVTNDAALCVV